MDDLADSKLESTFNLCDPLKRLAFPGIIWEYYTVLVMEVNSICLAKKIS